MSCTDIFLALIAILFPPIAVWVKVGVCTADSLINIALCVLGVVPGILHAWYIIAKYPDELYEPIPQTDPEGNRQSRVTYYYVDHRPQLPRSYGATDQAEAQHHTVNAGEGGSGSGDAAVPPTYAQAVKGDHKVQNAE